MEGVEEGADSESHVGSAAVNIDPMGEAIVGVKDTLTGAVCLDPVHIPLVARKGNDQRTKPVTVRGCGGRSSS